MKAIYIDTYQIHSYNSNIGIYVQPPIEGLDFPEVRESSYDKAGEHGGIQSSLLYGQRLITLRGRIEGSNPTTFEQKRREFLGKFAISHNAYGVPIEKTLKITTMTDLLVQIPVFIKDVKCPVDSIVSAKWQLQLKSPDFAIVSQTQDLIVIYREGGGGVTYPIIYPVTYGAAQGGADSISNIGTADSYPLLRFYGPLENPRLTNETTGKYFELNFTIPEDVYIEVDMKNKTVTQQGITNKIGIKTDDSDWFLFSPGSNNLTLITDDTADDGHVEVRFRSSYLGI